MTNQVQGEILFAGWDSAATTPEWAYTPWMPVHGDFGTFGVDVQFNQGPVSLVWNVETREAEEPEASAVDIFTTNQTAAINLPSDTAAKQWVRYKFGTGATADVSKFVVLRALQPSWQVDR